jgi:hypothetical protein
MNDETRGRERVRVELAMAVPNAVVGPLLADIASRHADEVLCMLNMEDAPDSIIPGATVLSVISREVLVKVLGTAAPAIAVQVADKIPFVIIDKYGTTVVMLSRPTRVNSMGGSA